MNARNLLRRVCWIGAAVLVAAAGCSSRNDAPVASIPSLAAPARAVSSAAGGRATNSPIKHVVILIQENRSFDNFFATYPGADGATSGLTHTGATIPLRKGNLVADDFGHGHPDFVTEFDKGKMDGFDLATPGFSKYDAYQYVDPAQIRPYWTLAHQYVLADHMFQTEGSGSFTAHQDLIAGGTAISENESLIDNPNEQPWACDAPAGTTVPVIDRITKHELMHGPFPCLSYPTLRDVLDPAGLSWRFYYPAPPGVGPSLLWDAFSAIKAVRYSPQWVNNRVLDSQIFSDIDDGGLANVSWVTPNAPNSDHPGENSDTGPSWVTQVVDAIGEGPQWNSTAIIVVWDDWGGFYDNVRPPQIRYTGLGFRVPCLIISPYAKKNYVSKTQYEFGSILKFIEDNWSLKRIGTSDADPTTNSIVDSFDFTKPARKFVPIKAKYSKEFFLHQPQSYLPVDTQ